MNKLLLGTTNLSKINLYQSILANDKLRIFSLSDFPSLASLNVKEGLDNLQDNAIMKAKIFAEASGISSLGDDTGVFIPALGGKPGITPRRWGGLLSDSISDEEWLKFFLKQIEFLEGNKLNCYRQQVCAIYHPAGKFRTFKITIQGKITKRKRAKSFINGSPFSAYFYLSNYSCYFSELLKKQIIEVFSPLRTKVFDFLEST
jgi:XTP/dITP diphosphohydrolase